MSLSSPAWRLKRFAMHHIWSSELLFWYSCCICLSTNFSIRGTIPTDHELPVRHSDAVAERPRGHCQGVVFGVQQCGDTHAGASCAEAGRRLVAFRPLRAIENG